LPQIEEGKLRALAVTSKTRWKTLPGVPTMAEVGYTDIEGENWQAVLVPAGTPKEVITLLNQEVIKIVMLPDIKERMAALGFEPIANTPEERYSQIRAEIAKWAKLTRAATIRGELPQAGRHSIPPSREIDRGRCSMFASPLTDPRQFGTLQFGPSLGGIGCNS